MVTSRLLFLSFFSVWTVGCSGPAVQSTGEEHADQQLTSSCGLQQRLLAVVQTEDLALPDLGITRYQHVRNEVAALQSMFFDYSNNHLRATIDLLYLPNTPIYQDEIANWGGGQCMPNQSSRLRQYIVDAGYNPDDYDGFFRLFDADDVIGQTAQNGALCTGVYGGNAFTLDGTGWGLLPANGLASVTLGWWSWQVGGLRGYMLHEYSHILDSQFGQCGEARFMNPDSRDDPHAGCIDHRATPDDAWPRSVLTQLEAPDHSACFPIDWSVLSGTYGTSVCPWEEDSFDDLALGALAGQSGWTLASSDRASATVVADTSRVAHGHLLDIDPAAGQTIVMVKNVSSQSAGKQVFQFDVRIDGVTADHPTIAKIEVQSDPVLAKKKFQIYFGNGIRLNAGSSNVGILSAAALSQWHHIRCDMDLGTDKLNVSVDGTLVASGVPMPAGPIKALALSGWDYPGVVYLDNLDGTSP